MNIKTFQLILSINNKRRNCNDKFYGVQTTIFHRKRAQISVSKRIQVLSVLQNSNNIKTPARQFSTATILIQPAQLRKWMKQMDFSLKEWLSNRKPAPFTMDLPLNKRAYKKQFMTGSSSKVRLNSQFLLMK